MKKNIIPKAPWYKAVFARTIWYKLKNRKNLLDVLKFHLKMKEKPCNKYFINTVAWSVISKKILNNTNCFET